MAHRKSKPEATSSVEKLALVEWEEVEEEPVNHGRRTPPPVDDSVNSSNSQVPSSAAGVDPFPLPASPLLPFASSSFVASTDSLCESPMPPMLRRGPALCSLLDGHRTGHTPTVDAATAPSPLVLGFPAAPRETALSLPTGNSPSHDSDTTHVAEALLVLGPPPPPNAASLFASPVTLAEDSIANSNVPVEKAALRGITRKSRKKTRAVAKKNFPIGTATNTDSCSCKNSRCLKLYCACFSAGRLCQPFLCSCIRCHNTEDADKEFLGSAHKHSLNCNCQVCRKQKLSKSLQLVGTDKSSKHHCSCKNTQCLKLYCACFQSGSTCDPRRCRCVDCLNTAKENILGGARQVAVDACLKRRRDAFDARPRKNDDRVAHVPRTSKYIDLILQVRTPFLTAFYIDVGAFFISYCLETSLSAEFLLIFAAACSSIASACPTTETAPTSADVSSVRTTVAVVPLARQPPSLLLGVKRCIQMRGRS